MDQDDETDEGEADHPDAEEGQLDGEVQLEGIFEDYLYGVFQGADISGVAGTVGVNVLAAYSLGLHDSRISAFFLRIPEKTVQRLLLRFDEFRCNFEPSKGDEILIDDKRKF
jgi:hypothetical protein